MFTGKKYDALEGGGSLLLDLKSARIETPTSIYPLRCFKWGTREFWVLGAEDRTATRIHAHLDRCSGDLSSETLRELHLNIPGFYVLVLVEGEDVIVGTDPYGILKLYWMEKDGRSLLLDDPREVRGERFQLDRESLKFFFVCNYTPSRHTFFKELSKLEPCTRYHFRRGELVNSSFYARLGAERVAGQTFLDRFHDCLAESLDDCFEDSMQPCLFLTGGIDSSFLFRMLQSRGLGDRMDLLVGRTEGLEQAHPIDNDFDVEYACRLAKDGGCSITVVPYDMSAPAVLEDFFWLRDSLFTEFAPAFPYLGLARSVPRHQTIINGQNADSVLSFGSMGFPTFSNYSIRGLHGFFSRYFYFFGPGLKPNPTSALAHLLRRVYYRRRVDFTRRHHLLGIGLHPENHPFQPEDSVFSMLDRPEAMADWFQGSYLDPVERQHQGLNHHALSVLLYNKTYMQGAANRITVLTSLLQGRSIRLPYTSLRLFELMTCLRPDWRYAYCGKFPNIEVGRRRLQLPEYIIRRCDPNNSDSSDLVYRTLGQNEPFASFLKDAFSRIDVRRFQGVLNDRTLGALEDQQRNGKLTGSSLALKLTWLDSILDRQSLR